MRDHAIYFNYHEIRRKLLNDVDYISLPRKVSNQTLMLLDRSWRSFFAAIKDYNKSPNKYTGRPFLPKYQDTKVGKFVSTYEKGAISFVKIKDGVIGLSGTRIKVQTKIHRENIVQTIIVPRIGYYVIEVVYEKKEKEEVKSDVIASIDLGLNNLATVAFNKKDKTPFFVGGGPLKSINQFYNKDLAEMKSKLEKDGGKKTSKKIKKLTQKRNEKIRDYMHKASRLLVNQLAKSNTSILIIGKNVGQKQDSNMGKSGNQNFVGIPTFTFLSMVAYKARLEGIRVHWQEESYTSKASFLDLDAIPVYSEGNKEKYTFSGYREKRGLYKIKGKKIYINADLNGAYNILRKAIPNAFVDGIEGFAVNPKQIFISA